MNSVGSPLLWVGFFLVLLVMLWIDIGSQKKHGPQKMTFKQSLFWTLLWITITLLFNVGFWFYLKNAYGTEIATQDSLAFFAGYLIEKSLAMDNVFVWIMIFSYFQVPIHFQRRILVYGVLGAIVLRALMIFMGSWVISRFDWVLYLFGAFLLITGVKMLLTAHKDEKEDLSKNGLFLFLKRFLPIKEGSDDSGRFWLKHNGKLYFTSLFLVLLLIEFSDVVFAVDSIPAIFAVTKDPFIVLTSNLFAILGLRAMYFLLAGLAEKFTLLKYGLAFILLFIGIKMLINDWYHIPIALSLLVIALTLVVTFITSLLYDKRVNRKNNVQ